MTEYFREKYLKLLNQSETLHQSITGLLIKKIGRRLLVLVKMLLDLLLFCLFLPLLLIGLLILLVRKKRMNRPHRAIICGLEHVIAKSIVRADWLAQHDITTCFYSFELTTNSVKPAGNSWTIIKASTFVAIDALSYLWLILVKKPVYVEIYFEGYYLRQAWYASVARLARIPSASILRGELYELEKSDSLSRWSLLWALKNSRTIFYRETYMLPILQHYGFREEDLIFDYNKVKVNDPVNYSRPSRNVLFLNGFKTWRRLDVIIKAIPLVQREIPDVTFTLVGARDEMELRDAWKLIKELDIKSGVEVLPWTKNSTEFYEAASIFVLPANLVYVNFSLLEAMERGVPAIVSRVEDADKIISDGVNGVLCEQDESEFSNHIIRLLKDDTLRQRMGAEARKTIEDRFNDKDRMKPIIDLIEKSYV